MAQVAQAEEPKDVGRALSDEEVKALLAAKSKSPMIGTFIRIALLTGLRFGEIRGLRWAQVDADQALLTITRSKTKAGVRRVPMSNDLRDTFAEHKQFIEKKLGKVQADWFVFPFCRRVRPVDPTLPVTTLKSAWDSVRKAAAVECRFHDLRHTAYTKMIEAGVPEGVIMALMGHVSRAMVERYSHVRLDAMRKAVGNLSLQAVGGPKPKGASR